MATVENAVTVEGVEAVPCLPVTVLSGFLGAGKTSEFAMRVEVC